jgi:hypothetical protein
MAQGDLYFQCASGNKKTLEDVIRDMIYVDENGKAVLHTDPAGTALLPYFTCDNKEVTLEQALRELILEDADGNPYMNTTS